MTNDEFRAWRERHFRSQLAASEALELHRDTVKALETGITKKGEPYPVRRHIALACAAYENGLTEPDERKSLVSLLRRAAELIESTPQRDLAG